MLKSYFDDKFKMLKFRRYIKSRSMKETGYKKRGGGGGCGREIEMSLYPIPFIYNI